MASRNVVAEATALPATVGERNEFIDKQVVGNTPAKTAGSTKGADKDTLCSQNIFTILELEEVEGSHTSVAASKDGEVTRFHMPILFKLTVV